MKVGDEVEPSKPQYFPIVIERLVPTYMLTLPLLAQPLSPKAHARQTNVCGTTLHTYPSPQHVGLRVGELDRGKEVNCHQLVTLYAAFCIWTSENSSSTHFVNKGSKRKSRGS